VRIKNRRTPWSYQKISTPLHRLNAGFKLCVLLALSLLAFFPAPHKQSFAILAGIAAILIALSFIAKIGPAALLRGGLPLIFFVLTVFLVRGIELSPFGFNKDGIWETAIFCLRLCAAFAAGTLLFTVTTPTEIRKSLSHLESAVHIEKLKIGLGISLMLAFLSRFFEIWEDVNLAWESRGGKNKITRRLVTLIPLVIERLMIKAGETAEALESRGGDL